MISLENRSKINIDQQLNEIYERYFDEEVHSNEEVPDEYLESHADQQALLQLYDDIHEWAENVERNVKNVGSERISNVIDSLPTTLASLLPRGQVLTVLQGVNDVSVWVKEQLVDFFEGFRELVVEDVLHPRNGRAALTKRKPKSLKEIVIGSAETYFKRKLEGYAIDKKESVRYFVNAVLLIIEDEISSLRKLVF